MHMYRDDSEWQYNNNVRCAAVMWKKQPEHFTYFRTFANDIVTTFGSTWLYWEEFSAMNPAKLYFVTSHWWLFAGFTTNLFLHILSRNSQVDMYTQLTKSHWKLLGLWNMSYPNSPHYDFGSYMQPASDKSLPIPFVLERQTNNQHVYRRIRTNLIPLIILL